MPERGSLLVLTQLISITFAAQEELRVTPRLSEGLMRGQQETENSGCAWAQARLESLWQRSPQASLAVPLASTVTAHSGLLSHALVILPWF